MAVVCIASGAGTWYIPNMERVGYHFTSSLEQAAEKIGAGQVALVLDVDEVLVNSVRKHVRLANLVLRSWGYQSSLPTYEEACLLGGTTPAYSHVSGYPELNRYLRHSPRFNSNQDLIHQIAPDILNRLPQYGFVPVMYLTTRPTEVAAVTQKELERAGCPSLPVIARPPEIAYSETTNWKIEQLTSLANLILGQVVMVDDSVSLNRAITALNHPKIKSLLFSGPITNSDGRVAATWETMIETLTENFGN